MNELLYDIMNFNLAGDLSRNTRGCSGERIRKDQIWHRKSKPW